MRIYKKAVFWVKSSISMVRLSSAGLSLVALCCGMTQAVGKPLPVEPAPEFVQTFLEESGLQKRTGFTSGFETASDFSPFYIVPQNHSGSASHSLSTEQSFDGKSSHKAWIYAKNPVKSNVNTNHRAYPTIQMEKTSMGIVKGLALVEFAVWPDIDLHPQENKSWISLATFTSYSDTEWYRAYLVNVDSGYKIHLMHVPYHGESGADIFAENKIKLPQRKWSKISVLIDYTSNNRFKSPIIAAWQDGALVAASRFNDRIDPFRVPPSLYPPCLKNWDHKEALSAEKLCALKYEGGLAQMHFGLYAPPLLSSGVIYNDALTVSEIIRPTPAGNK